MKNNFWCSICKSIFNAEGLKKEWNDQIYGPCMKYTAVCPKCKAECDEYRDPNEQKKQSSKQEMACGGNCHSCEFNH